MSAGRWYANSRLLSMVLWIIQFIACFLAIGFADAIFMRNMQFKSHTLVTVLAIPLAAGVVAFGVDRHRKWLRRQGPTPWT